MEESAEDIRLNKLQILQPLLQIPCHIIHHNLQKKNIFASKEKMFVYGRENTEHREHSGI